MVFSVSLECTGAELEGPGFEGVSEAGRRCLETGRNSVPPFSANKHQSTANLSGRGRLTDAGRHGDKDQKGYQSSLPIQTRSLASVTLTQLHIRLMANAKLPTVKKLAEDSGQERLCSVAHRYSDVTIRGLRWLRLDARSRVVLNSLRQCV